MSSSIRISEPLDEKYVPGLAAGRDSHAGERFNIITHLAGLILSVAAAIVLIYIAMGSNDICRLASVCVFAASAVLVYTASTLYHSTHGAAKRYWARADHCAIYILIASTYTPLGLVVLAGTVGTYLTAAVWGVAILGVVREVWLRPAAPSVGLYVLMGWLGIAAGGSIIRRLSAGGLFWLLFGVGLYMAGLIFYSKSRCWRHAHGIWHLFVVGGTMSHFVFLAEFVV